MQVHGRIERVVLFVVSIWVCSPRIAHAYIDPGTGSYVFQILIAGLVAALYLFKQYWARLLAFFKQIWNRDKQQ